MQIKVITFASLKPFFPKENLIELPENSTVNDLMNYLIGLNPGSKSILGISMVAINEILVDKDRIIKDREDIYLLPPVSGG